MAPQDGSELEREVDEPGRDTLPAGHPVAWSALVSGTALDGMAWPGWGGNGWDALLQGGN